MQLKTITAISVAAAFSLVANAQLMIVTNTKDCYSKENLRVQATENGQAYILPFDFNFSSEDDSSIAGDLEKSACAKIASTVEELIKLPPVLQGAKSAIATKKDMDSADTAYDVAFYTSMNCTDGLITDASNLEVPTVFRVDAKEEENVISECKSTGTQLGYIGIIESSNFGELKAFTSDKCTTFQNHKTALARSFACTAIDNNSKEHVAYFRPFVYPNTSNDGGAVAIKIRIYQNEECDDATDSGINVPDASQVNKCISYDGGDVLKKSKSLYVAYASAFAVVPVLSLTLAMLTFQ